MNDIESQSYRDAHRSKDFFVPTWPEVTLYSLVGLILLIVFNSQAIISLLGKNYFGSAQNLKAGLNVIGSGFGESFSSALGGRLGQIILWSFIGALTYIAIWFIKNLFNSFENDVIIDHYAHPGKYNRLNYWESALAGKIFFTAALIIFLVYVFISAKVLFPAISTLAGSAAYNFTLPSSPIYILLCAVLSVVLIYIFVLLLKLVSRLWSLI